MSLRRGRVVVVAVVAAAALAGCTPDDLAPPPAESRVDVDTPALREAKRAAQVEPCSALGGPGSDLPALTLPCLGGGEEVVLAEVSGPAVIPLWASWCEPCKDELPLFARLADDLEGRAAVVGVDYQDTQPDLALQLLEKTGARFPQLADPGGSLAETYRIRGLPGILWVGEDGSATFRNDRVRSYEELTALVSSQLGLDVGPPG